MKDHAGVVTIPPLIYAAFLLPGIYWRRALPVSLGPEWIRDTVGWLLIVAGVLLAGWALVTMVRSRTTFNPFGSSTAVVSSGPFRLSRNPIYLGDALIYAGVALLFDALLALLLLPLVILSVHYGVVRREEAYLERKFGEAYLSYRSRVRRWL